MKKRIVLAFAAILPFAIAYAANQGKTITPVSELAPTEAQGLHLPLSIERHDVQLGFHAVG